MSESKKVWLVKRITGEGLEDALNAIAGEGYQVFNLAYQGDGWFTVSAFDPVQLVANMQRVQAIGLESILKDQLEAALKAASKT